MYQFIAKFLLPHAQRYAANYVADYLNNRREQRFVESSGPNDKERSPECPPCPPCPGEEAERSPQNKVWLAMSGLLLGGALGTIGYLFVQDIRAEQ